MGDPAELSEDERAEVLELAKRIVQSVIDDETMPPIAELDQLDRMKFRDLNGDNFLELRYLQLAQELIRVAGERDALLVQLSAIT